MHPLSDLTKEIEVNGEKFIPIEKLPMYEKHYVLTKHIKEAIIPIRFWETLLSWHFDLFGLIDAGLAVDINTVKF